MRDSSAGAFFAVACSPGGNALALSRILQEVVTPQLHAARVVSYPRWILTYDFSSAHALEVFVSTSHHFSYSQKRRSTRLDKAVPVAVQGVGAYREPYQDQVSTLSISCHGCTYNSKYEVIRASLCIWTFDRPVMAPHLARAARV